jgi:hypothetical protein
MGPFSVASFHDDSKIDYPHRIPSTKLKERVETSQPFFEVLLVFHPHTESVQYVVKNAIIMCCKLDGKFEHSNTTPPIALSFLILYGYGSMVLY